MAYIIFSAIGIAGMIFVICNDLYKIKMRENISVENEVKKAEYLYKLERERMEKFKKEVEEDERLTEIEMAASDAQFRAMKKKKKGLLFKVMAKQPTL